MILLIISVNEGVVRAGCAHLFFTPSVCRIVKYATVAMPIPAGSDELQRFVKTNSRLSLSSLFLVGVYDLPYLRRDVLDDPIKTFIGREVGRSEE